MQQFEGLIVEYNPNATALNVAVAYARLEGQFSVKAGLAFHECYVKIWQAYNEPNTQLDPQTIPFMQLIFNESLNCLVELGSHLPLVARSQYLLSLPSKVYQNILKKHQHWTDQQYLLELEKISIAMFDTLRANFDIDFKSLLNQPGLMPNKLAFKQNNLGIDEPCSEKISQFLASLKPRIINYLKSASIDISLADEAMLQIMYVVPSVGINAMPEANLFCIADRPDVNKFAYQCYLTNRLHLLQQIEEFFISLRRDDKNFYNEYQSVFSYACLNGSILIDTVQGKVLACKKLLAPFVPPTSKVNHVPSLVAPEDFKHVARVSASVPSFG